LVLHPAIVSHIRLLMKATNTETTMAGAKSIPKTKRDPHLSKDDKWRSFPKVPNLLQYVTSGTYYARTKVVGKLVRLSLETTVFSTARLRLPDKLKELRKPKAEVGTFADGRIKYEAATRNGYTSCKNRLVKLAPLSVAYRLRCLERLHRSLVEFIQSTITSMKEYILKPIMTPQTVSLTTSFDKPATIKIIPPRQPLPTAVTDPGECPAIVGFKSSDESRIVHGRGLELLADKVAPSIRIGRGCLQVGLARCFTGTRADIGKGALVFGFPLESAARCLAASVRQV